MSHLIDTMAYTGQTPWHQLGHALPKKQSIDVWTQAAGMQWKIQETPVRYMATGDADALYGEALEFPVMLSPYSRPRPSRNKAPGPSPVPGALVQPAAS